MYILHWLGELFKRFYNGFHDFFGWFVSLSHAIISFIQTGDTSGFDFIGGTFGKLTDGLWNLIQQFNIFGDFGVGILYNWIPDSAVTGALTYMFTFLCLIGSLKLLKKILPFW